MSYHDQTAFSDVGADSTERRSFPRYQIALSGVCSIAGGPDAACVLVDLSLDSAALQCECPGAVGDRIVLALPHLGLLEARLARTLTSGFAVAFDDRAAQLTRIRDYLAFTEARNADRSLEDRDYERIVPLRRVVTITRDDGRTHMARIVDASRTGIALSTTVPTGIGARIVVGSTTAEIVRVFDGGCAARFLVPLGVSFGATIQF